MDDKRPGADFPANPLEKPGYRLDFQDEFDAPDLDTGLWLPFYLPHWSSREQSAPRYALEDGCLVLQITKDQQPWCPEFDGPVKCSSIQTGQFSGSAGSQVGQHRFNPACTVREAQENVRRCVPLYGFFEMRAKAVRSRRNHVALWMIGYEDSPERSGEIAVFEIMGAHVGADSSRIGYGVRKWFDPALHDAFYEEFFPMDAGAFHVYAVEWSPGGLDFYLDNVKIKSIRQSPAYPMQFMLGIYELPPVGDSAADDPYPKSFVVDYFRGYSPVDGYSK